MRKANRIMPYFVECRDGHSRINFTDWTSKTRQPKFEVTWWILAYPKTTAMVLPALPTDEEFRSLKTFPFQEGRHFEFKSSIQCSKHKVLPTVCGFLNVGGGHMIFGIADDLAIKGFTASTRELDTFLLYIDNIVRNGAVLKEVGTRVRAQLPEGVFIELFVKIDKDWQRRPDRVQRLGY
jgi:hypothetical protein